ncbi:MAG: hypothetical protein HQ472_03980 [Ignavibacteria bacterium]|nr:hypothetical protein [Ignavibacteria bacterium]
MFKKGQDALEKRRADRSSNGDTLTLSGVELKKFLPGDISDYTASEPETSSMEMEDTS